MPTDEQLMEQLRSGETDAIDELYQRYARTLYAFCYSITRSEACEDLVHDVFMRNMIGRTAEGKDGKLFRICSRNLMGSWQSKMLFYGNLHSAMSDSCFRALDKKIPPIRCKLRLPSP